MDPQHLDPSGHVGITGEEGFSEPPMLAKRQKSPQRLNSTSGRCHSVKPVLQMDGGLTREAAFRDIKADAVPAIREDGMLTAIGVVHTGQPGGNAPDEQAFRVSGIRWPDDDRQSSWIKRRMPEDASVGRRKVRTFGENVSPMKQD